MIDLETARREVDRAPSSPFADEFAELFARQGAAALERHGGGHHVTASCLVFDPIADSVLLNHHGKAQLWGQFGGHLEPVDVSLRAGAQREPGEEGGLPALSGVPPPPRAPHARSLSAASGTCPRHYDVVFAARASVSQSPTVSSESIDVAWFSLTDLPSALMPDLHARLPGLFRAAVGAFSSDR